MGSLGAPELILIILAVLLLFGYKKLPDASRSLGRSLRIFKGEMKGMKDDDVRTKSAATTTPVRGEVVTPTAQATSSASARDASTRSVTSCRLPIGVGQTTSRPAATSAGVIRQI